MNKHAIVKQEWLSILMITMLLTACGGGTKIVPVTIQSDPLGGHVTYQLPSSARGSSTDWIYLGKTPIDLKQNVDKSQLRKAQAFRVKVFKDGYNDQVRDWSENEIDAAVKEKGHIFWNPKLVPHGS
jgi:hypothetical protein